MPRCPFCGGDMERVRRSVHKSSPSDTFRNDLPKRIALVEVWHCRSGCHFIATFEHPITDQEYNEYLDLWNGHRIEDYAIAEISDEKIVRQRLEALGYVTE